MSLMTFVAVPLFWLLAMLMNIHIEDGFRRRGGNVSVDFSLFV